MVCWRCWLRITWTLCLLSNQKCLSTFSLPSLKASLVLVCHSYWCKLPSAISLPLPTDPLVCTGCCSTLNHILTYLFKRLSKSKGPLSPSRQTSFLKILEIHPEILQQMLSSVMNVIMFESCRNQWSMSRPLLGLILLNEEVC